MNISKYSAMKNRIALGLVAFASVLAAPAFAQSGPTIDPSSVVAYITAGLATVSAIGAAWVGFKYLKKVWDKV